MSRNTATIDGSKEKRRYLTLHCRHGSFDWIFVYRYSRRCRSYYATGSIRGYTGSNTIGKLSDYLLHSYASCYLCGSYGNESALAGCILQGILRNPLADPGIIGVTAGAGLAAMALMLISPELTYFVPFAAFGGAVVASIVVFLLAWEHGIHPLRLILAGVAIAAFFGGGSAALSVFFSDRIQGTVNWMAGGFAGNSWRHVVMILPYSAVGIVATMCSYRKLNALQLGDDVAASLGLNVERVRFFLLALSALLAASAVSVAGLLGFVGLIIPHIMRLIVGSDFEYLLPASAVFGAVLVVLPIWRRELYSVLLKCLWVFSCPFWEHPSSYIY